MEEGCRRLESVDGTREKVGKSVCGDDNIIYVFLL